VNAVEFKSSILMGNGCDVMMRGPNRRDPPKPRVVNPFLI